MAVLRKISPLIFLLFFYSATAQDFHYSLINTSPLNLNPALTGIFDFDYINKHVRYTGNYRQQWRSVASDYLNVATPFTTASLSIDGMIKRAKSISRHYGGVGVYGNNDRAGDLGFGTQQFGLALAYHQAIGEGYHYVSGGASYGWNIRSFDINNAYFDNQWNGLTFDPTLSTGENFPSTRFTFPDLNFGVAFHNYSQQRISYQIGLGVFHLLQPKQSFYLNPADERLKRKFAAHGLLRIPLELNKSILPSINYIQQGSQREGYILGFYKYDHSHTDAPGKPVKTIGFQVGGGYRAVRNIDTQISADAMILAAKFRKDALVIGAAYDINLSGLGAATQGRGAFELSIIYYMDLYKSDRKPHVKPDKVKCPPGQQKKSQTTPDEWKY